MATVPSPRTWANRDPLSTTNLNAGVRDPALFALAPPLGRMRHTSAQSIPNATGTALSFGTEDVDSANGHSTSSNTSRYAAQYAGWYQLSGGVQFATNATGRRGCWWAVNGTVVNGSEANTPGSASGNAGPAARVIHVFLSVNDYVELCAFQDSGGSLNTAVTTSQQPTMEVRWVSN